MNNTSNKQKKQKRVWFNSPYKKGVVTNIAKMFLKVQIDKHFPKINKLHKIFNCNLVKVSYSCTENISQVIASHNKIVLQPNKNQELPCICGRKTVVRCKGEEESKAIYIST